MTPSSTRWCGTGACLPHVPPRELIQLLFIGLDPGERGPDQTDPRGAGGSSGMHIFQSKNGSQPSSPAQHQPFPLFIPGLQGAIAAHSPSQHPHKGSTAPPSQEWDQEGNIRRGRESPNSEEHQDQTQGHVLVPPPKFHTFASSSPTPKAPMALGEQSFSPPRLDLASLAS